MDAKKQDRIKRLLEITKNKKRLSWSEEVYKTFYFDMYVHFLMEHDIEDDFIRYNNSQIQQIIYTPFNFPISDPYLRGVWITKVYNSNTKEFDKLWTNYVNYFASSECVDIIEHPVFGVCIQGTEYDVESLFRHGTHHAHAFRTMCSIINDHRTLINRDKNKNVNTIVQFLPKYLQTETSLARMSEGLKRFNRFVIKNFIEAELPINSITWNRTI